MDEQAGELTIYRFVAEEFISKSESELNATVRRSALSYDLSVRDIADADEFLEGVQTGFSRLWPDTDDDE